MADGTAGSGVLVLGASIAPRSRDNKLRVLGYWRWDNTNGQEREG